MNLRVIKKDIEYLIGSVIDDCTLFATLFPDQENQDASAKIIDEAIDLYNNLKYRVNHPDKQNIKAHYAAISKDLNEGVDALFEKLSSTATKE